MSVAQAGGWPWFVSAVQRSAVQEITDYADEARAKARRRKVEIEEDWKTSPPLQRGFPSCVSQSCSKGETWLFFSLARTWRMMTSQLPS